MSIVREGYMFVRFYCECKVVTRDVVLNDLDYQYESTEPGFDHFMYDVYSNSDGDYFAVKEDE